MRQGPDSHTELQIQAGPSLQESESESESCSVLSDPLRPHGLGPLPPPPGSSVHGSLQASILEWVAMPSSRGFPNPGIEPRSPAFRVDSLPTGLARGSALFQWQLSPSRLNATCLILPAPQASERGGTPGRLPDHRVCSFVGDN